MQLEQVDPRTAPAVARRSRSLLLLVDGDGRVVLGENEALQLLLKHLSFGPEGRAQLGSALRERIRERLSTVHGPGEAAALGIDHLVLRVIPMSGCIGSYTALTVEAVRRREDLVSQRARYHLTRREVDVLRLILQGLTAAEVSEVLLITKNTVTDYFKSLLHKTDSRNRSEMIAKILGWEAAV